MLPLLLMMQSMGNMPMPAIDTAKATETLTEVPGQSHRMKISVSELAASTIAYCKRTKQSRCENQVSSMSGGAEIVVCRVSGKWLVNKCPTNQGGGIRITAFNQDL